MQHTDDLGEDRITSLHLAITEKKSKEEIQLLAEQCSGDTINASDKDGRTPLHLAALLDNKDAIDILLAHGAKIEATDEQGNTPLGCAASGGAKNAVEVLIERGALVNAENNKKYSPLHLAVISNNPHLIETLLRHNVNLETRDEYGLTPLSRAAYEGKNEAVKILLDHQLDINANDVDGETPLDNAIARKAWDIAKLLADHGAVDSHGNTLLHRMIEDGENIELIEECLEHCEINAPDKAGWSPLYAAIDSNRTDLVRLLLNHGANVETTVEYRESSYSDTGSALFLASGKKAEIIKLLIEHKADVNARSGQGRTLLDVAVNHLRPDVVQLLVDNGASTQAGLNVSFSPWDEDFSEIRDIVRRNRSNTLLHCAVKNRNEAVLHDVLNRLDELRISIDAVNDSDQSSLHIAVKNRAYAAIATLLQHGASSDLCDVDGYTPLDLAMKRGDLDIIQIFSQYKKDFNVRDSKDSTPLHRAVKFGSEPEVLDVLLQSGADINAKDSKGLSPLSLAVVNRNVDLVKFLILSGADEKVRDKDGNTLLHLLLIRNDNDQDYARCKEQIEEIAKFLLDRGARLTEVNDHGDNPIHLLVKHQGKKIGFDESHFLFDDKRAHAANDLQNKDGETPLHLAARTNSAPAVYHLLEEGSDPIKKNKEGYTPFEVARRGAYDYAPRDMHGDKNRSIGNMLGHELLRNLLGDLAKMTQEYQDSGRQAHPKDIQKLLNDIKSEEHSQTYTSREKFEHALAKIESVFKVSALKNLKTLNAAVKEINNNANDHVYMRMIGLLLKKYGTNDPDLMKVVNKINDGPANKVESKVESKDKGSVRKVGLFKTSFLSNPKHKEDIVSAIERKRQKN